ncbi:MAG TPA: hypothetical protein VEW67_09185 [Thermoleophilaceae bacterium]|nr:hypothetical protein [Thermoleophilaceae bacterium]
MKVTGTDNLGMVRVRFSAAQREPVLRELRDHRSGHLDSLRIYALHPDKYGEDDHRLTREKMAVVERALDYAEGTEPGRPFDLVVPIWLAQSLADNGARIAVEALRDTLDSLLDGRMPDGLPVNDARAAIRDAAKETRVWIKTLLSAHKYPRQPLR